MSYIYRCGCVGETDSICPIHKVSHIIHSSAAPNEIEEDCIYRDRKIQTILSNNKKPDFYKKFNLVFLPSSKRPVEKVVEKGDPAHKHAAKYFAKKHLAVIYSEYDDFASNIASVYRMGYKDKNIRILTSLRAYDIADVQGHHAEFRGFVILFGKCSMERMPKSIYHLGQLCMYEASFINLPWVKRILHYNAESFRVYLAMQKLYDEEKLKKTVIRKRLCIKTEYVEIFNLIKSGAIHTDALRCITNG